MYIFSKRKQFIAAFVLSSIGLVGCTTTSQTPSQTHTSQPTSPSYSQPKQNTQPVQPVQPSTSKDPNATEVVSNPESITVLVNKQFALPEGYTPPDLVEPNIPFIFKEKDDRRLMRKEATTALEKLVAGAKKDGIYLAGVSGYRSYATQKDIFEYYVRVQGKAVASKYSAIPRHSEHQTGLAIDVSGSDGRCAAEDCFGDTPEAKWLAQHAFEYGYIVRYQKGKESITGYNYEPWHIRYVGIALAKELTEKGITLDQYYKNATPVSK